MLNKIKARLNNKKGFTLVELIVVIVIILILAAVLVPNVTKYVSNARIASLKSDASSILTQLQADCTASIAGEELGTSGFKTSSGESYTVAGKTATCVTNLNGVTTSLKGAQYVISDSSIAEFAYGNGTHYIIWKNGEWLQVDHTS